MRVAPRCRKCSRSSEEAVTAPLSAILGVAIVVSLVVVYSFLVSHLNDHPVDNIESGAKADFSQDGYWVAPSGPESLPVDTGQLVVTIDGTQTTVPLSFFASQLGGSPTWNVGVRLCIVGPGAGCYKNSGTTVDVTAIAGRNVVFQVNTLRAPGPAFSVTSGNTLSVLRNGTVVLGALGAQYACGNNMDVFVRFSIDDGATWILPLGNQPVAPGGSGQTFNQGLVPKGSKIVVEARGVGAPCGLADITINTRDQPNQALMLQSGDPAPSYAPFQGQQPLVGFLAPYVNTQLGTMVLQPNQVIILFDICCYPNSAVDFQDLVVLFTFP